MAVKDQEKAKTKTVRVAKVVSQPKRKAKTAKPKARTVLVRPKRAKVATFRQVLHLTQPEFARLVPISVRSLASLEAGAAPTEAIARKLIELERLAKSLAEVMRQETIGTWLKTPNPAFDGLKPLEVIERGEIDRLWSMIYFLRSGVPS
jgi:DNA-binding transcriptional regulator YiaG